MTGFAPKPMLNFGFSSHAALSRVLRGSHIGTYAALLGHSSPCLEAKSSFIKGFENE